MDDLNDQPTPHLVPFYEVNLANHSERPAIFYDASQMLAQWNKMDLKALSQYYGESHVQKEKRLARNAKARARYAQKRLTLLVPDAPSALVKGGRL